MISIKNKFDLNGRVAVLTGASKGIGKAIAQGLAEFGAHVVVSSRNQNDLDVVVKEFTDLGLKASGMTCHVGSEEDCKNLIESVVNTHGRIDILVSNAGTNPYFGPVDRMPLEAYEKTLKINLTAGIILGNLVKEVMAKQEGGGSIIHISSIEGLHATANFTAYNISKAGLITLAKNQAIEWGKHNIRVNAICPGFVKTKLSAAIWNNEPVMKSLIRNTPLQRMATPDEMAGMACFLASDASSFVTGSVFLNDGGLLNAPLF